MRGSASGAVVSEASESRTEYFGFAPFFFLEEVWVFAFPSSPPGRRAQRTTHLRGAA